MILRPFVKHGLQGKPFRRSVFRSIVSTTSIPNTGSMARDCLAAERTFLAWARTGLGFVGAGSALFAAWNEREADVSAAAAVLIGNGSFLLLFATRRYLRILQALQSNMFPLDTRYTLSATAVTALGTATSMGLVAHAEARVIDRNTQQSSAQKENRRTRSVEE